MRPAALAVLGIAAYAVFLAASMPARFVAQRISVPGAIELVDAQGTVWDGRARALVAAGGPSATLDDVRWHFLPARIASGRLAFALDASGAGLDGHAEVERGPGAFGARDVHARADAAALAAFLPLVAGWRPEGAVTLVAPAIAWNGREAHGEARLEWRDAALAIGAVRPLGSYRLEARAEGGPARITLTTLDGALRLAGTGTFTPPDALAFAGDARAEGPTAAALEPLLNLLGPRRADGARTLEWHTSSAPRPTSR
ncbi:MAG TPA: type II secretion system protein N [Usitatibacter sp.]|jgi:general secretion pathway protein N|nr:type II secretion system protein N [Usitatibacter sp.]